MKNVEFMRWVKLIAPRQYPQALVPTKCAQERRNELIKLRWISQLATPLFQSEHPCIAAMREPFMRLLGNRRVVQRYVMATLTGLRGFNQ